MNDRRPGTEVEVVVVGGGPAGAAAATTLARAGRSVVLVDKAEFPRDKTCGDGLTAGALRLLEELGLDPAEVASWQRVDDVVVRSPSGREVTFPLPRSQGTYAAVARRVDLDAAVLDLARRAGAELHLGHACTGVTEHPDRVAVEVERLGTISARWLVAADGIWSPVRRHLGLAMPGYRGEMHAFRQYFDAVGPRPASDLFVWFEPDLLPGYVWSFPLPGNRANVGFGILRGGKVRRVQDMAEIWRGLLDRPHIREVLGDDAHPEAPHRAWPIPARIDEVALVARRTMFVGDAAAATDPMTGEGIGQALLTGRLAAQAIVHPVGDAGAVTSRYRLSVHQALVADHRMSKLLARALHHRKSTRGAIRVAGLSPWTRRHFARWLFEDYPRAILVTPRRWHRRALSTPGAYAASDRRSGQKAPENRRLSRVGH
ncbi:MAG: NAD(P)/FAD-dependent oxidoreductase [Acidimicrobiales bacterium]